MKALTIDQAAAEIGVTRRTIYTWIREGRVETVKTAGDRTMVIAESLWRTKDGRPWKGETPTRKTNTTDTLRFPGRTLP